MSDIDILREQIRSAFPPAPYVGTVTSCPCEECTDIKNWFYGKAWVEISQETIDFTCCPTLMEPSAFCAFLPAFLLRGLDDPRARQRAVADLTLYALIPDRDLGAEYKQSRTRLMDDPQKAAVRGYIEYLRNTGGYKSFEGEIATALNSIWR